jgi:recombination protein RecR
LLPDRLGRLVHLFARLPGVGEKTAQRFVLHLVASGGDVARDLGEELASLRANIAPCASCGHVAEVTAPGTPAVCAICRDPKRDPRLLCVVGRVQDLLALERSGAMRGRYFVLGRLLSPLEGVGPEDLPLDRLARRIEEDAVTEVLVATPPSVDGEATALLLARELAPSRVKVSRIASGVPHGGDLEFADPITLGRAVEGRKALG